MDLVHHNGMPICCLTPLIHLLWLTYPLAYHWRLVEVWGIFLTVTGEENGAMDMMDMVGVSTSQCTHNGRWAWCLEGTYGEGSFLRYISSWGSEWWICYPDMMTSMGHMSCCNPDSHCFSTILLLWVLLFVCLFFVPSPSCSCNSSTLSLDDGKHWWTWCHNRTASLRHSFLSELVVFIFISEIPDPLLV